MLFDYADSRQRRCCRSMRLLPNTLMPVFATLLRQQLLILRAMLITLRRFATLRLLRPVATYAGYAA